MGTPQEEQLTISGDTVELRGNKGYDIYVNNTQIGVIEGDYCFLQSIQIDAEHRNKGYGTEAVRLFIELARQAGCDTIKTSAVLHSGLEHILVNKFDFEPLDGQRFVMHL